MKKLSLAILSMMFSTPLFAGHMPSIEIKIQGSVARWVQPQLVVEDNEDELLPLFQDRGLYIYDDAAPGSYVLRIIDNKTKEVLLTEPMTVKAKGHHLEGNYRSIECSLQSGEILCLNLL